MARSEYRDKIKELIDDIESTVNDALGELSRISEDSSTKEILEHVDYARTVLERLSEKLY